MRLFANLFSQPTPEKIAARELENMRLTLFQAERRLLEAQMQVDYCRDVIAFLEDVAATGVEGVVDKRRAAARPPPKPRRARAWPRPDHGAHRALGRLTGRTRRRRGGPAPAIAGCAILARPAGRALWPGAALPRNRP